MAVQTTDSLLLAIETTADLAGIRAVKEGIQTIPPVIAGMSEASRRAFDAMDATAKKAAMSTMGLSQAEQAAFLGVENVTAAVTENTSAVNVNIGAYAKRGELIDRNSVEALNAYRAEGEALKALLRDMGATEAQLKSIGTAIGKVEQQAGAAAAARANAAANPQLGPALPPGGIVPSLPNPKVVNDELKKVPGSARTAANALAMLSNAAINGQGSAQGMMVAVGGLTTGLAALSTSARVAASATGIGALITLAATVGYALYKMGDQAKASKTEIERLNAYSAETIGTFVDDMRKENDRLMGEVGKRRSIIDMLTNTKANDPGTGYWGTQINQIRDLLGYSDEATRKLAKNREILEAATHKAVELESRERIRLITQRDQIEATIRANELELAGANLRAGITGTLEHANRLELEGAQLRNGTLNTYRQQQIELATSLNIEKDRIKEMFKYRDEHGHIVGLTQEQEAEQTKLLHLADELTAAKRAQLAVELELTDAAFRRQTDITAAAVGLGGNDVKAQMDAKEAQIRAEGELDIAHGRNRIDVERSVQAKIVELRRATMKAAADDAKTIVGVLLESGSRQVKAIGHAADAVRRVQIGAQAAHAAVESAIEFGKAIGSAASFDFRGAALHAASGLALAKAAALGAKESLGGGGAGASGGSGGGGGADPNGAFRPRTGTEGQGNLVINLLTQDPYGATKIQQVMYELNRAEVLGRPPVAIPPTTGIQRVA